MAEMKIERRNDIDWLRIFATYLLFIFHVGKVFDKPPFYQIKNGTLSDGMKYFTGFIHIWHMPLFFLLAGWSVFNSLKKRSGGEFFIERVKRLFIPLVMGIIVFCPPMQYVYARTAMGFEGTYLEFLPLFFTSLKYFSWSHLWFLAYLFTFTLLYYWLFARLIRREDKGGSVHPAMIYAPIIALVIIQVALRPIWPGFQNLFDDWANFTYYSTFFIMGFVFSRYPAFEALMHKQWKIAGALALFFLLAMLVVSLTIPYGLPELVIFAPAGYCVVIFMLGFARRFLASVETGLSYARESAYPVYILHQASIVLPGYFVVQLDLPIYAKYPLLLAIAVTASLIVYHLLVRPFNAVRFLFGMRGISKMEPVK